MGRASSSAPRWPAPPLWQADLGRNAVHYGAFFLSPFKDFKHFGAIARNRNTEIGHLEKPLEMRGQIHSKPRSLPLKTYCAYSQTKNLRCSRCPVVTARKFEVTFPSSARWNASKISCLKLSFSILLPFDADDIICFSRAF